MRRWVGIAIALSCGCGSGSSTSDTAETDATSTSTSTSASTSSAGTIDTSDGTTGGPTTSPTVTTVDPVTTGTTTDETTTAVFPDGPVECTQCDLFAQDCPAGERCVPWSCDGTPNWNGTRCSPVADEPAGVGEPCTMQDSPWSGLDDCER